MTRRRRVLTSEEREIWRAVAETANRRTQPDLKTPPERPRPAAAVVRDQPPSPPPTLKPICPTVGPAAPPPPLAASGLDRATETRLRKGKRAPDARLDLHGMTAARAHGALHAFIRASSAARRRCVLVITGKGGAFTARAEDQPAPGVLRREVPVWLATPPLRGMVVNVSQAHRRHGGEGALYVYLKRFR